MKHVPQGRWNGGQLLVLDLCTHSVVWVQAALHHIAHTAAVAVLSVHAAVQVVAGKQTCAVPALCCDPWKVQLQLVEACAAAAAAAAAVPAAAGSADAHAAVVHHVAVVQHAAVLRAEEQLQCLLPRPCHKDCLGLLDCPERQYSITHNSYAGMQLCLDWLAIAVPFAWLGDSPRSGRERRSRCHQKHRPAY